MTGRKNDNGKPAVQLIPPHAILEEARVMGFGAHKYTAHNYLNGMKYSRLVGAAMRHLLAWSDGEDVDPESGVSHLAHLRCCAAMLMEMKRRGVGEDDRIGRHIAPSPSKEEEPLRIDSSETPPCHQ